MREAGRELEQPNPNPFWGSRHIVKASACYSGTRRVRLASCLEGRASTAHGRLSSREATSQGAESSQLCAR